ncbi:GNAT family N-acetyltransferase [Gramella jeungdoensis]|uniref:GNAT family N-acetyltransferase n=1 Tax=Gramella jeungdoensis TaxID=708091 RepID=A0ABT0Z5R3_9FLAO|nr:GNAT family N-acetyltransferase [Gramella jeungdoensis]MCM8571068.1 GNAT family N-acetyltransferase [Gramella jeungdoensis]
MEIKDLKNISISELAEAFNLAFSDYLVPLQLTEEQLAKKMKNDGVNLDISAGAFENGRLVGFILHGKGSFKGLPTAYNAGTGVIPSERGKQITGRLYDFILPILKEAQTAQCLLEVITYNGPAIKIYEKIGYERTRELLCFKGSVTKEPIPLLESFSLNEPDSINSHIYKSFFDWDPSWQNSFEAIERSRNDLNIITAEKNEEPVAFITYNPETARVSQFAVKDKYRKQGVGTLLFQELQKSLKHDISIINIDSRAFDTISFLKSIGLKAFLSQYEMIMKL